MSYLNEKFPMEVISADSRQVYKGFTVGTGKPSLDVQRKLPHHLIDILEPVETFTAGDFCRKATRLLKRSNGHSFAVVGGTGLYIRSLTQGLSQAPRRNEALRQNLLLKEKKEKGALYKRLRRIDPLWAQRIHPNNLHRVIRALEIYEITKQPPTIFFSRVKPVSPAIRFVCFALLWPREVLRRRIRERITRWLKDGWEEEVARLLKTTTSSAPAWKSVGYLTLAQRVLGKVSHEEALQKICDETCQYAKRQMTWFRAEKDIHWIPAEGKSPKALVAEILKKWKN